MICIEEMMKKRFEWCFTYEPDQECQGASGRKLRQDCVYCPCYAKYQKREKKNNVEKSD